MRRREHGTQGRRGPRRAAVAVLAAVVALVALGGGAFLLLSEYAFVGGRLVDRTRRRWRCRTARCRKRRRSARSARSRRSTFAAART